MDQPPHVPFKDALGKLWSTFLPLLMERVSTLQAATDASTQGEVSGEQMAAAKAAAHNLAGTLGTFGLKNGTDLAREAEQMLSADSGIEFDGERLRQISACIRTMVQNHDFSEEGLSQ